MGQTAEQTGFIAFTRWPSSRMKAMYSETILKRNGPHQEILHNAQYCRSEFNTSSTLKGLNVYVNYDELHEMISKFTKTFEMYNLIFNSVVISANGSTRKA